jgi:hypothetical protein
MQARVEPGREVQVRHCPTVAGDGAPLIVQTIGCDTCLKRQAEHYHKCHRCVYRGKAADYVPPSNGTRPLGEEPVVIPRAPIRPPVVAAERNGTVHAPPAPVRNGAPADQR